MGTQMDRTELDLGGPSLRVQCFATVTIVFLFALLSVGGIGPTNENATTARFNPSVTTTGIEETHVNHEASNGAGFGAQPRLFEPRHHDTVVATVSPTRTSLETQLQHESHLRGTIESMLSLQSDRPTITLYDQDTETDSHFQSPAPVSSSEAETGAFPSHPVTIDTSAQSSDSLNYNSVTQKPPIFASTLAFSSPEPTVALVGTTVRHDQLHGGEFSQPYDDDDEVIVESPGDDSESNLMRRVAQTQHNMSTAVNVMEIWNVTTASGNSMVGVTAPALVMTSPPYIVPHQQEPSSESQVRQEESHIPAGTIAGIVVASVGFAAIGTAALGFALFRRLRILRNKSYDDKFPNDNCGYLDSLQVSYINSHIDTPKESGDEMFSLDNDSFLNSLEAMTMENYWAEDSRNTKV